MLLSSHVEILYYMLFGKAKQQINDQHFIMEENDILIYIS